MALGFGTFDIAKYNVVMGAFGKIVGWAKGTCFTLEKNADNYVSEDGADGYHMRTKINCNSYKATIRLMRNSPSNANMQTMDAADSIVGRGIDIAVLDNNDPVTKIISGKAYITKDPVESVGNDASPIYEWNIVIFGSKMTIPSFVLQNV